MSFFDQLQKASFRGVPFGVNSASGVFGRRISVHEYPFRDKPWAEDLGRATRKITVVAYLVEDAKYGGGDVIAQRDALIAACENSGSGPLVHPTLGRMTVSLLEADFQERKEEGRYFEVTLSFIESGERTFPSSSSATSSASKQEADSFSLKAMSSYVTTAKILIARGASIVSKIEHTVSDWTGLATGLVRDATALLNQVAQLPGDLGRFFGGRAKGFTGTLVSPGSTVTVSDLIAQSTQTRADVAAALTGAVTAAANGDAQATADAAQDALAQIVLAMPNPADGVRLLGIAAGFQSGQELGVSELAEAIQAAGTATAGLIRRLALSSLAKVAADYQPSSADDAARLRNEIADLFDAEIVVAGDEGDDDVYLGLRGLREAVIDDLNTRGAALPPLKDFDIGASLPSLVLAQQLYRDPARADQLVTQLENVPHPAFCPAQFNALAK